MDSGSIVRMIFCETGDFMVENGAFIVVLQVTSGGMYRCFIASDGRKPRFFVLACYNLLALVA